MDVEEVKDYDEEERGYRKLYREHHPRLRARKGIGRQTGKQRTANPCGKIEKRNTRALDKHKPRALQYWLTDRLHN